MLRTNLHPQFPACKSSRALAACERSTNTARDVFPLDCPHCCGHIDFRPLLGFPRTDRLSMSLSIALRAVTRTPTIASTIPRSFFPPSTLVHRDGFPSRQIRMFARSFSARRSPRTNPRPVSRAKIDPSRPSLGCPAERPSSTSIRLPASRSTRTTQRSFSGLRRFPVH